VVQVNNPRNFDVDIDLTHDHDDEQGHGGVIGDDERKIFVLSMSDESGNSDLHYRIMLFTSDAPHISNTMAVENENCSNHVTSRERGHDESVDVEMDQDQYNSDDYASLPRVSNSMKSDSTIKAEEQRKKFIDVLFKQRFYQHQSKDDKSIKERNCDQPCMELVDDQSNDDKSISLSRISQHSVKSSNTLDEEGQQKGEVNQVFKKYASMQQYKDSNFIHSGSIDSDLEFIDNSDFDSKLSYSVTSDRTINAEQKSPWSSDAFTHK
jgi:hypothetical protein